MAAQRATNAPPAAVGDAPALVLVAGETSAVDDVSIAYLSCEQGQVVGFDLKREKVMSFIGERENRS